MFSCGPCGGGFEDGILCGHESSIPKSHRRSLSQILEEELRQKNIKGTKSALEYADNNDLTFTQLNDFSDAIARDIRDRVNVTGSFENHNPDGDPLIAICVPRSERAVSVIFGILKTGAAYLPLNPQIPETLLLDILNAFRPLLLIADENSTIFNKFDTTQVRQVCPLVSLEELWVGLEIATTKSKRMTINDPDVIKSLAKPNSTTPLECQTAIVIHTRGLHGNPVGVRLSHLSIINRMFFDWNQTNLKQNDSCSLTVCLSTADSVAQIFSPLLRGCTLHVFSRNELNNMSLFLRAVGVKNITRLSIPHHHFRSFLLAVQQSDVKETKASLSNLKLVICRGGVFRDPDVQLFFRLFRGITLWQCSGPAETTGEVVYERFSSVKDFQSKRILGRTTLGRIVDNTKLYILGQHLGMISDGNQGEICVAGLCLGLGYVNEQNLKERKAFIKNPHDERVGFDVIFRTGEYGRIIVGENGKRHLYNEGREDKLLKRDGHLFSTEDIAAFLKDFSFTKEAYVFTHHKGKPSQEIIGFILPEGKAPDVPEIEYLLRSRIPEWAMPDDIMVMDEIPKHMLSDELCPYCLMDIFRQKRQPRFNEWDTLGFSPEIQKTAVTLIKGIYKFTSIPVEVTIKSMDLSFFDLGGTSANAVILLIYLNKHGFPVSLKDLYSSESLTGFVTTMDSKKNTSMNPKKERRSTFRPPSYDEISRADLNPYLRPNFHIMLEMADEFRIDVLSKKHRRKAVEIIARAYAEKGELQSFNMVSLEDFISYLTDVLPSYENEGVSIVVTRKGDKEVVAVALCLDFFTIIDSTKANGALFHAVEFFQEVKGSIVQFVPHRQGETLEMCWMATHPSMKTKDNIRLIVLMHREIIKFAKLAGFSGIFNPTTNKLSRTLCLEVYGFVLVDDFRANKYKETDGSAPFHLAGELIVAAGLLLKLRTPEPSTNVSTSNVVYPVPVAYDRHNLQNKDFEHASLRHFDVPEENTKKELVQK